ncbi:hypothetical protein SAMN05216327_114174 [Dyadobacter sp. SG02]|nr:hypothetical protein SAMN05216327_114174 [Dyadobacter sp. SG02]
MQFDSIVGVTIYDTSFNIETELFQDGHRRCNTTGTTWLVTGARSAFIPAKVIPHLNLYPLVNFSIIADRQRPFSVLFLYRINSLLTELFVELGINRTCI